MKIIACLFLLAFVVSDVLADNQVVVRKYRNKAFKNAHLGIVSLSVKGTYKLTFLASKDLNEQQAMVRGKLLQGLPRAFEEATSCTQTEVCTTAVMDSISPCRLELDHDDTIIMNLPARIHFQGKKQAWPAYCLVMEIIKVYDDSSIRYIDVSAIVNRAYDKIVRKKDMPEECLHYSCNYAFIDCASGALVCYGHVTAEGCGVSDDRYGQTGVWRESLNDLAKQITENSPFEMKSLDASDFH